MDSSITNEIDLQPDVPCSTKFAVGDHVFVGNHSNRVGIIAFVGQTEFAEGEWIGVKLNAPNGKNDGSVNGVSYFECPERHGLFTRRNLLKPVSSDIPVLSPSCIGPTSPQSPLSVDMTQQLTQVRRLSDNLVLNPANKVGDRVQVSGARLGTIRYLGPTDFASGDWVGVELDDASGKNDGSVLGRRYFVCKPNHGLFSAPSKIVPFNGKPSSRMIRANTGLRILLATAPEGSRESLQSMSSNFSSVSKPRVRISATGIENRKPGQSSFSSTSVHTLESVVKEKEAHIEQLLQEFEMERSELAKVTMEREQIEMTNADQRSLIGQLQMQIDQLQMTATRMGDENAKLKLRVHEEMKRVEELQFRLEEEDIDKTTLEAQKVDTEERIFELEEALAAAKEANERIEADLGLKSLPTPEDTLVNTDTRVQQAEARAFELEAKLMELQKHVNSESQKLLENKDTELRELQSKLTFLQDELIRAEKTIAEKMFEGSKVTENDDAVSNANRLEAELTQSLQQQTDMLTLEQEKNHAAEVNVLLNKLSQAEVELESAREKVINLEREIVDKQDPSSESSFDCQQLVDELQKRLDDKKNQGDGTESSELEDWAQKLINLSEEVRKLKGLAKEPDEETAAALAKMSIKLLEAESELAERERIALAKMSQLTQTELDLKKAQETPSSTETVIIEELTKRLEVLEAERCLLATSLTDRQREGIELQEMLSQKNEDVKALLRQIDHLEQTLSNTIAERDQKLIELNSALGISIESSPDEILKQVTKMNQQWNDLQLQYVASKSRMETLTSQRSQIENEVTSLQTSANTLTEVDAQVSALKKALLESENRYNSAINDSNFFLQQLESKSMELQTIQERLLKTVKEHESFQDEQAHLVTSLETEKRIFMERLRRAENRVEKFEKDFLAHSPNVHTSLSTNGKVRRSPSSINDSYDSQVNFLNSIIADLHTKNSKLEDQLRLAVDSFGKLQPDPVKITNSLDGVTTQQKAKLRFWCDNCEEFDLHDTDFCPNSHIDKVSSHHLAKNSPPLVNRVYCDNCEIFDLHSTEECTEVETY